MLKATQSHYIIIYKIIMIPYSFVGQIVIATLCLLRNVSDWLFSYRCYKLIYDSLTPHYLLISFYGICIGSYLLALKSCLLVMPKIFKNMQNKIFLTLFIEVWLMKTAHVIAYKNMNIHYIMQNPVFIYYCTVLELD